MCYIMIMWSTPGSNHVQESTVSTAFKYSQTVDLHIRVVHGRQTWVQLELKLESNLDQVAR